MSGVERVLEIAASTRVLRDRRARSLDAAPGGARVGLELLNLRALAERCAAETGEPVRALLGAGAQARLVAVCAARSAVFGPLVAERPGLAAALASTLRDLRDAGVPAQALPDEVAALRALYTDVERAFERLLADGLVDRIGLFRIAARGARAWAARCGFARAEVHGATELVGSAGDLVDALAGALEPGALRFFQPDWGDAHAEQLRAEWPWRGFAPEPIEVVDEPALTRDGPIPPGALRVLRAPSPREELEGVAREILVLLERGVPPHEIQVVARTLEPYSPWLEAIFDGYGIPVTSSLGRPALARPAARAWLDLVRALANDLERAAVVRMLEQACTREVAAAAERLARVCAVLHGEADWRAALADPLRTREARLVEGPLGLLFEARRAFAAASSFGAGAAVALDLAARLLEPLTPDAEPCRDPLREVHWLDDIGAAAGAGTGTGPEAIGAALESALFELRADWHADDAGGVRVLDAVQARALPCRHLFLIGCVHGAWPRDAREDPFLPDATREALRAKLRRPVPVRAHVAREDRFLFGLLLSQATDSAALSFPDVDGRGRTLSPSILLRNLPFVAGGTDVSESPSAPACAADAFARAPQESDPELVSAGRELVALTASGEPGDLRYDAVVGAGALRLPGSLSPTFVEDLLRCAQRGFFKNVLNVRELDAPAPRELASYESGIVVHAALALLMPALFERGLLARGAALSDALDFARAKLPEMIDRAGAVTSLRVGRSDPALWRAFARQAERAALDFLARDLETLQEAGVRELRVECDVPFDHYGPAGALRIVGRPDRIVTLERGTLRVGDYKSRRDVSDFVSALRVQRGLALQIPLYTLALAQQHEGARVEAEVLAVPLHPERDRDGKRDDVRGIDLAGSAAARPALDAAAGLLAAGAFPLRSDPLRPEELEVCEYCAYTLACRRDDPAAQERLLAAALVEPYYALRGDP